MALDLRFVAADQPTLVGILGDDVESNRSRKKRERAAQTEPEKTEGEGASTGESEKMEIDG